METINLTNHFLIAMPNMADPYFSNTLTYICEHSENGAIGLVINKPIDITLGHLFEQVNISLDNAAAMSGALSTSVPSRSKRATRRILSPSVIAARLAAAARLRQQGRR